MVNLCLPPLGIDHGLARSSRSHVGDGLGENLQRMKEVKIRLLLEALKGTRCGDQVDGRAIIEVER
jgi:hypothetical protein